MRNTLLTLTALCVCLGAATRPAAGYNILNAIAVSGGSNNLTTFGAAVTQDVAAGQSYAGISSKVVDTTDGSSYLGTTATILEGTNTKSSSTTVAMRWRTAATVEKAHTGTNPPLADWDFYVASDVLNLTGMNDTVFVLQLSYVISKQDNVADGSVNISSLDITDPSACWLNAVDDPKNPKLHGTTNDNFYAGSYDDFRTTHTGDLESLLGCWGVDTANHEAWAVLDSDGVYAVVPEPATVTLLATGGLCLAGYALRRRKAGSTMKQLLGALGVAGQDATATRG